MKILSLKIIKNLVQTLKRPFSAARSSYELRFGVDFGLDPYFKNLIWIFENLLWISSDFDLRKFRNHKNFEPTVLEAQKELSAKIWSRFTRARRVLNSKLGFNKSIVDFSILVF